MKTHPRLTFAAILGFVVCCALLSVVRTGSAQPEAPKPTPKSAAASARKVTEAQSELQRARDLLKKEDYVSTRVVETVNLRNYGFTGTGRYLQGPKRQMLYEIEIQLAHTTGKLLEVCDGEILYSRHEVRPRPSKIPPTKASLKAPPESKASAEGKDKDKPKETTIPGMAPQITVVRKDVQKIFDVLARHPNAGLYKQFEINLGLGGLPVLLTSIDKTMNFDSLKPDTLRGRKVNVIEGTWTSAQRDNWITAEQKAQGVRTLPGIVPDFVRIAIDAENGFPHRIEFFKRLTGSEAIRSMVALDFLDVTLGKPIDPQTFRYKEQPGELIVEQTAEMVQALEDLALQSQNEENGAPQKPQP